MELSLSQPVLQPQLAVWLWELWPIIQLPLHRMGLNAYFTYSVCLGMGVPWQTALAAVFVSGLVFIAISMFKIREAIVNAIPMSLKLAIGGGIGLF